MPCRGPEPVTPTQKGVESRRTCQMLVYILEMFDQHIEDWITEGAKEDEYCWYPEYLDEATRMTCEWCKHAIETGQEDTVIFDAHSRKARRLADWWEEHQELDKKREKAKKAKAKKARAKKKAMSKLTKKDKEALGL
jgi:hypothetical protein